MSEWISVKDRLPNHKGYVLCIFEKSRPFIAAYEIWDKNQWTCDTQEVRVTHWMPLPESPK